MRKRNYLKRLLSFVLMAAMIVGMVNMPAKAAEVATKVKVNGLALDGDYLYPRFVKEWNAWYIYFKTDVDIPGSGDVTLTLQNGTTQFNAQACRGDSSGVGLKWLLVRISDKYLPIDGDTTISVKTQTLTFGDGASMELQAFSFNLSGGVWSMAGKKVMPSVKYKAQLKLGTSWDANYFGNTTTFYLHTEDTGIYYQDPDQYDTKMTCIDTDEDKTVYYGSRVWKWQKKDDGTYKTVGYDTNEVIHFARRTYSVRIGTDKEPVTDGDIYQFQGYYQDKDGNIYGFFPVRVKYENGAWSEITDEIVEKHDGYLNVNQADWAMNADNSKILYLQGSDAYLAGCEEKWTSSSAVLSAVDGTITVNGKTADVAELQKYQGTSNYYFLRFNTDIEKDAVLTIEGTFKAEKASVTFEKSQFKWDGTKWTDVSAYSGTLLTTKVSGAEIDSTKVTGLYMKGSDTYMSERTYSDWDDNDIKLVAADENSGVYIDDVRNANAQIWKYNAPKGHYYLANADLANANKVVIKGNFKTLEGRYALSVDESTFTWNGSNFVNATGTTEPTESLASVTMAPHFNNDWFAPTYDESKGGWRVYFYTSEALKGNVDDKYTLSVSNGTEEADITFTQSADESKKEIYAYFPKNIVDGTKTQTITIKAGEYKATNRDNVHQEYGMKLTSDSKIYVTEYGWSTDKSMVTPTTAPVSFTLKDGSAEGIHLNANVDDTVPFGSAWTEGTVSPILISQETYGVQSGVFKNGVLTEVCMMKIREKSYYVALSDKGQTASVGDVYTIKGMFRHTDGQSIACTELKVKWNGESWEKVFDSFETNLSWKLGGSWFYPTYDAEQDGWRIYLKADMDIPALQGEVYKLNVKIDGTTHVINFTKSDAASPNMHAYIPKSLVSGAKTQTIEFQPGTYNAFSGDVQKDYALTVKNTLVMRVNEYGWTTEDTHIAPSYHTKENIQLDTSVAEGAGGNENGFYLTTDIDDEVPVDNWSSRIYLPAATDTTYYSGGVWKQEVGKTEKTQSYEKSQLIKLGANSYYVALKDAELVATSPGDTYTVGGIFMRNDTGITYGFSTITVTWDGAKWTQNYQPLDDTGVKYDVNADSVAPTTKDLIALLKYNADNSYRINTAQADINNDSKINKEDVGTLRRIIVGSVTYQSGKVYGMPSYSENRVISKAAYASVKIGDWDGSNLTVSSYYDDKVVDAEMQKYKAAGINLLLSEGVAQYHQDPAKNEPIKRYLEAAERNGLGVLVFSGVIQYMFTNGSGPEIYNWAGGTWQDELDKAIVELRGYSDAAFKGFMIWDEIQVKYLDTFNKIASYLHEKYPELILMTSQLPSEAYTVSNLGPDAFTTDTTNNNTVDKAYKDYVNSFSQAANMFIFDSYPLILTNEYGDAKKTYSVSDNWFANHKYVAEVAKESGYNFNKGVTIQSCQLEGSGNWWSSNVRYAPEMAEDIGFQVYTSMAYGVKEIHYFTYNLHHIDNAVSQTMATNTKVYDAVSTINNRIDKFANVYQAFSWRDTQDIEKGKSAAKFTTDSERLTSATVTGARTLIGHMVDSDGFDGYMLANAAGPRTTTAASVAMTFADTTKVIVYDFQNGTRQVVSGTTVNISVPVGGGIMVIPVR